MDNIFNKIPDDLSHEVFEDIIKFNNIKIERIISNSHSTLENEWYDQEQNEWVIILKGSASIKFEDNSETILKVGDYINIPSHKKHRVEWTDSNETTIWLAIHYW